MTIIELFDKPSIEGIVSALMCLPDKVVMFGSKKKSMQKYCEIYSQIVEKHTGKRIEFEWVTANRNNLGEIVEKLIKISESNDDCIIDLDGGEDLFLVAAGIAYERLEKKPQLHRFNAANNTLYDCDDKNAVSEKSDVEITIEENLNIHGGGIVYEESLNSNFTYKWNFSEDFISDIFKMWNICRADTLYWNYLFVAFEALLESQSTDSLDVYSEDSAIISRLNVRLLKKLESARLIYNLAFSQDSVSFTFKNEQVRQALSRAGTVLELYTTVCASELSDGDKPLYNDILTGVVIDWDNEIHSDDDEIKDVQNEIDVILSKGIVPVFISCKNGQFSCDELYKLNTVANQFASKCVKKVLVSTNLEKLANKQVIRRRAAELKIKIIDNVDKMSKGEFQKALRSVWNS